MAKVKQVKMRLGISGEYSWKETIVSIHYDATDEHTQTYSRRVPPDNQRFYINLPAVVADALGEKKAFGKDQDDVMKNFKELIKKFKYLNLETKEIICYEIEVSPTKREHSMFGYRFSGQYRVEVWACAYKETKATAGDGNIRYSYEMIDHELNFLSDNNLDQKDISRHRFTDKPYERQIPLNEQNAAFFIWIKERMKELVERLDELNETQNMIETITAGRLLPLGNTERKGEHGE